MARSLMRGLRKMFKETVSTESFIDMDGMGVPSFSGTVVSRKARVVGKHKLVKDQSGQERMSTVTVWFQKYFEANVLDRYTLPSRFALTPVDDDQYSSYYRAIAVDLYDDENGAHHTKVYF